jgi:hypothetical protein
MTVIGVSVMIGLGSFYTGFLNAYGLTPSSGVASSFTAFNTSYFGLGNTIGQIQANTGVTGQGITSIVGILDIAGTVVLGIIKFFFVIPGIIQNFVVAILSTLSGSAVAVPGWVGTMVFTIIIIVVVMQVVRMVTKSFFEV